MRRPTKERPATGRTHPSADVPTGGSRQGRSLWHRSATPCNDGSLRRNSSDLGQLWRRRVLCKAICTAVLVGAAAQVCAPAVGAAPAPKAPKRVTGVAASPGVGSVTVSWTRDAGTGITYTVSSSPAGAGCTVVDADSCSVAVTTSTPWRFAVTAGDAAGTSAASASTRPVPHRILLVVAGQSNALGATSYAVDPVTGVNYLGHPYTNGADKKDLITWPGWWELAPPVTASGLVPLDTPQYLNFVTTPTQIFGPELGLARQIWTDTSQAVTIDKVVYSDSSLVDWSPATTGGLFDDMVGIVRQTMATDAAQGQLDTIGGFYWYQGESDAMDPALAADYQSNLTAFVDALRSDLPMAATAPVVLAKESLAEVISVEQYAGICATPDCASLVAGDDAVRAADDWVAANLPHVLTVDSLGLARTGTDGGVHLSNVGELQLGDELATVSDHQFP